MLTVIIVAAGSSSRAGFDKLFAKIAERPVIQYSLEGFERAASVDEIIVVSRAEIANEIWKIAEFAHIKKLANVVPGGQRRQDSVAAGLRALGPEADFVAVHDAARPLITSAEIERVFMAAREHGAATLAAPVTDTLKLANPHGFVGGSINRENVFAMQTPQIFRRQLLVYAYESVVQQSLEITDEVSAVETAGGRVAIVPAKEQNIKLTFASDIPLAEMILKQRDKLAAIPT